MNEPRRRLPFTWVDALLWICCAVFVAVMFPKHDALEADLDWIKRTGVVHEMQRMGLTKP